MAEDLENTQKPKVILNKQKKTSPAPAGKDDGSTTKDQGEKKKVVVVKKKTVVVKAPVKDEAAEKPARHPVKAVDKPPAAAEEKTPEKSVETKNKETVTVRRTATSIELSPPRPNVKVGNLADRSRPPQRGPSRDGFSGAQAREQSAGVQTRRPGGYQGNRGPGQGYNPGPGQNRGPGQGYTPGPGQNRGPYQGGPNRGPYQGGPNRGPYQGGPNRGPYQGGPGRPGPGGPQRGGPFTPAPPPMQGSKGPAKRSFKGKKNEAYNKKNRELDYEEKLLQQKKKAMDRARAIPKEIEIMETISVSELARKMNLKANELIGKLMGMGMMVTMNQSIDSDIATILAQEFGCKVNIVSLYDETVIESNSGSDADLKHRPPVVTIMGHVDHGKTKTLDAIRSAKVAEGEFGGITQHIGAYTVKTEKGIITFLDTPGHEAFTMMRARGAAITDIVILVVAADDGVMPQTVEAINHAKDAKVPIIVAVNKIDKPEANPDKVKTKLSDYGLVPEDWGGDTMFVNISALQKTGIDTLLDAILLQAEVLELTADWECRAEGKVIESRIDHGRGIIATIIVERGTLKTGDPYVAGVYSGRVRAIFNEHGEKLEEATPSMPVEILGLEGMPNAGDPFQVTETERNARQISDKRQELKRFEDSQNIRKVTLDNLYDTISAGDMLELKVIIKGDVQGSVEALKQSLEKLSTKDIRLNVIHASAGAINDSDVMLAAADSNAIIIGFNVRPTPQAKLLAEQEKVDIRKYNIIYKAVEEIEMAMEGMLSPDVKEDTIGTVEVREVIKVPKIGAIAGSYRSAGCHKAQLHHQRHPRRYRCSFRQDRLAPPFQGRRKGSGVRIRMRCGAENFNDIHVGDQLEVIEYFEVARKLKDSANEAAPKEKTE